MSAQLVQSDKNRFCIEGDVCFATTKALYEKGLVLFCKNDDIELSFSKTNRIDSSVLSLMLAWRRFSNEHHIKIHYVDLPQHLCSLIEVSDLTNILKD